MGMLVIPHGVVVEPVMLVLAAGTSDRILRQNVFVVPFLEDLTGVFVQKHADVFNGVGMGIFGQS